MKIELVVEIDEGHGPYGNVGVLSVLKAAVEYLSQQMATDGFTYLKVQDRLSLTTPGTLSHVRLTTTP